jgi:hypothetical protein
MVIIVAVLTAIQNPIARRRSGWVPNQRASAVSVRSAGGAGGREPAHRGDAAGAGD